MEFNTENLPRVVVFGNGSGFINTLKGVKQYTNKISAIPTFPSGEQDYLKSFLKEIVIAVARKSSPMKKVLNMEYRKDQEGGIWTDFYGSLLERNLSDGLRTIGQVLSLNGEILSLEDMEGSSDSASVSKDILYAITHADLVIYSPCSFFTGLVPSLSVNGMRNALALSKGIKIFVCPLMTETGSTDNFGVMDFLNFIKLKLKKGIVDAVIINNKVPSDEILDIYEEKGIKPVRFDEDEVDRKCFGYDMLLEQEGLIRHEPVKLGDAIFETFKSFKLSENELYVGV